MWCLMRPSLQISPQDADPVGLGHHASHPGRSADLPTTPSQLGAPPCKTNPLGFPFISRSVCLTHKSPEFLNQKRLSTPDVQLAPQQPDVHPWPNTLCLAANPVTVSKIHFTCTALTFYPFTHAFHLQAQRLVTPSDRWF